MSILEATPAYRVLTSRDVLTGEDGLVGINTHEVTQGALVLAAASIYRLDRSSTAVDDGLTVLTPLIGPGRWLFVAAATGGMLSVDDLATLATLGVASPDLVWVESLRCYFKRQVSGLAADGITVVNAIGSERWERLVGTTSQDWLHQIEWYIDPSAGNDEGAGTVAAPIKTIVEFNRRVSVGEIAQSTSITYVSAWSGEQIVRCKLVDTATLTIQSLPTVVATDTISARTPRTHAGATPEATLLQATGIADWTPYVTSGAAGAPGHRIRVTTGASAGAVSWIARANPGGAGNNVARVSPFISAADPAAEVNPALGSGIAIETLLQHDGALLIDVSAQRYPSSPRSVKVKDLAIINSWGFLINGHPGTRIDVNGAELSGNMLAPVSDGLYLVRSHLADTKPGIHADPWAYLYGCLVSGGWVPEAATTVWAVGCLFQRTQANGYIQMGSEGIAYLELLDDQFFGELIGASVYAFLLEGGVIKQASTCSGSGYGFVLRVSAKYGMSRFIWSTTGSPPNIKATTAEIRVDGPASADLTWATAKFRSNEQRGTATLGAGGTITVSARNALTQGVHISRNTPGGTPGELSAPAASRTASQFVINSTNAADSSTVDWFIPPYLADIEVGPLDATVLT